MDNYNGNGIWIPVEILHNSELTSTEKILYAEIYYLDRPDTHCTASNEYLAKFLKMSESGIKKCLTHLKSLGYIYTASFDGRRRSIATSVRWTNQPDTGVSSREIQECPSAGYSNSVSSYYIENSIENSIEKAPAQPDASFSVNHKHKNIYKERETLSDDLASGKDIDNQTKSKKKSKKELDTEECLAMLDSYSSEIKELLTEYFLFISDRKRALPENKNKVTHKPNIWRSKLDRLDELVNEGYDCAKLIQQSLDNGKYVFYPLVNENQKTNDSYYKNHETSFGVVKEMTAEEKEEWLSKFDDPNTKIY